MAAMSFQMNVNLVVRSEVAKEKFRSRPYAAPAKIAPTSSSLEFDARYLIGVHVIGERVCVSTRLCTGEAPATRSIAGSLIGNEQMP